MWPKFLLSLAVVFFGQASAWACPYCQSDLGREVAARIFNQDFAWNGLLVLSPLFILLGLVLLIHYGWPGSGSSSGNESRFSGHD